MLAVLGMGMIKLKLLIKSLFGSLLVELVGGSQKTCLTISIVKPRTTLIRTISLRLLLQERLELLLVNLLPSDEEWSDEEVQCVTVQCRDSL